LLKRWVPLLISACLAGVGGGVGLQPVINASAACDVTVNRNGPPAGFSANGFFTKVVCPAGVGTGPGVLEVQAATGGNGVDGWLCIDSIADPSAPTAVQRARRSHLPGSTSQRVAIGTPLRAPQYLVRFAPGGTSCTSTSTGQYQLLISYRDSPDLPASNGFSFSNQELPPALGSNAIPGGGEPSIVVDRLHGNRTYISAPGAVPSAAGCIQRSGNICNGTLLWYSMNGGQTFTFCNPSLPNGGGDTHLAVDTSGSIYGADLGLTNVDTQKLASSASGPPTPTTAPGCGFANTLPTAPEADRQWLATYLPDPTAGTGSARVYLDYHDFAFGVPLECTSLTGGTTWLPCTPMMSDPDVILDASCNTQIGNQVVDSHGNVYGVFTTSTPGDNIAATPVNQFPCPAPNHNIYLAKSSDGLTWTNKTIALTKAQHSTVADLNDSINIGNVFVVTAVDKADNLYVVWSQERAAGGPASVKFTSSTDHGDTWSKPITLNDPRTMPSAVLPWIVAGEDGAVDVVWVGSSASKPNDTSATWYVYMAQSLNAHSGSPTFTTTRVTPQPVRYGWICFLGLLCNSSEDGRILLDFIMVDVDSNCMANISYASTGRDSSNFANSGGRDPWTGFAKQTGGQPLGKNCSPPTTTATIPTQGGPKTLPLTRAGPAIGTPAISSATVLPALAVLAPAALLGGLAAAFIGSRRRKSEPASR
jgi:hypothetical protein